MAAAVDATAAYATGNRLFSYATKIPNASAARGDVQLSMPVFLNTEALSSVKEAIHAFLCQIHPEYSESADNPPTIAPRLRPRLAITDYDCMRPSSTVNSEDMYIIESLDQAPHLARLVGFDKFMFVFLDTELLMKLYSPAITHISGEKRKQPPPSSSSSS